MKHSKKHQAFVKSEYFKQIQLRGLQKANAKYAQMPKCGAKRKGDGKPCQNPVKETGMRCRLHGGATPKGNEWHRRQLPKKGTSEARLKVKQVGRAITAKKLAERLAEMTHEEREKFDKRSREMQPGTIAERTYASQNRKAGKLMDRLRRRSNPVSEEHYAREVEIEQLEARAEELRRKLKDEDLPEIFR